MEDKLYCRMITLYGDRKRIQARALQCTLEWSDPVLNLLGRQGSLSTVNNDF